MDVHGAEKERDGGRCLFSCTTVSSELKLGHCSGSCKDILEGWRRSCWIFVIRARAGVLGERACILRRSTS